MESSIEELGKNLVKCPLKCSGILNCPEKGIIPRCLFLENREGKNGSIVVGLNPGTSKDKQREFYIENNCSYESTKKMWKEKNWSYFERVRKFLNLLGFDGPIVWTDLVKCELNPNTKEIPIQTMRTCINRFLRKEIELCSGYTIIANGKEAFKFCSLSFPNHFVLGIPHSSGSRDKFGSVFVRLLKDVQDNKKKYLKIISNQKDENGNFRAVYLKP